MDPETKSAGGEKLHVFSGEGDARERREMADILRELAAAIDEDRYVGNPLLVLEEECLRRLEEAHRLTREPRVAKQSA